MIMFVGINARRVGDVQLLDGDPRMSFRECVEIGGLRGVAGCGDDLPAAAFEFLHQREADTAVGTGDEPAPVKLY